MSQPDPSRVLDGNLLHMWNQLAFDAGMRGADPPAGYGWQQGLAPALPDGSYVVAPQAFFTATPGGDDAVWFNNALTQTAANTGGNTGGIVRTLPVTYNMLTPVQMQTSTTLNGRGILAAGSSFTGSYMIVLANPAATYLTTISDVFLLCGNSSMAGPGGIQLDNTGWNGAPTNTGDNLHTIDNVIVFNAGGDSFHLDNHVRGLTMNACKAYRGAGYGFYLGTGTGGGCTDSHFTDCVAGYQANHGFNILANATNNMFQGCKAFVSGGNWYTGSVGTTECGFYVSGTALNTFVNCNAQQSGLHGFDLETSSYISLTGCSADSNGAGTGVTTGAGIHVNASTECAITGNVGKNFLSPGNQVYGISVSGACSNTTFSPNAITGTTANFHNDGTGTGYFGPPIAAGRATLSAGTVTVSTAAAVSGQPYELEVTGLAGTPGALFVSAITPGTSFAVTSTSATDASTFQWTIYG